MIGGKYGYDYMLVNSSYPDQINFQGYCVDLLVKLAGNTSLNFDYEIIPTARNVYGAR